MDNEDKLISVIIPCYNVSRFIDRCVRSLVEQTIGIDRLMCIFVDDASTDDTLDRLYSWEEKYPDSIMVIACEENGKQGRARNIGMYHAAGRYIGFVDADDYIDPEMYEKLYEAADRENVDVAGCLMQRELMDGTVVGTTDKYKYSDMKISINSVEDRKKYIFEAGIPGGVVTRIYRSTPELLGGLLFPDNLTHEDNYWGSMLAFRIRSMYFMDAVYYHYIVNINSTIMKNNSYKQMDRLVIELMKIEEYKKSDIFEVYHDEIEREFLILFYINTLKNLFARFNKLPYDLIRDMQRNVLEQFPDYENNKYYNEFRPLERQFLESVRENLTDENIDALAEAYVNFLDN